MKVHTLDTKALIGTDSILKFKNEVTIDWVNGQSGSTTNWYMYSNNGTYSKQIIDTDPYGYQSVVWETYAGPSQSGNLYGGFNMPASEADYQTIDTSKTYRFSVWVNRKIVDNTTPGDFYFGLYATTGTTRVNVINKIAGTTTNNAYFTIISPLISLTHLPQDQWRLCVGMLYAAGTATGGTISSSTGLYYKDGTKITGNSDGVYTNDFIFTTGTTYVTLRAAIVSNSATNMIGQMYLPRIDVVDGTEPTINELLYSRRPIQLKDNNLLYYGDWADGQSGYISYYIPANIEADSNTLYKRQMSTSPYGFSDVVWTNSTTSTNGTTMGGYSLSSTAVSCDTTKTYRYSLWYKLVVKGTEGDVYFGPQAFSSGSLTNLKDVTDSTVSTNKYFTYSTFAQLDSYYPVGEWRLCVGYIRPYGYTGTTNSSETGIWKPDGTNLGLSGAPSHGDQKFENQTTTSLGIKVFAPYSGSVNTVWETYRPRIDIVDGTEPSITELLKG